MGQRSDARDTLLKRLAYLENVLSDDNLRKAKREYFWQEAQALRFLLAELEMLDQEKLLRYRLKDQEKAQTRRVSS